MRIAVLVEAILTCLLLIASPTWWPLLFTLMGLAMAPVTAWGRWYATVVEPGWLGRVFGVTAAGVSLINWVFDTLSTFIAPGLELVLLSVVPLLLGFVATGRINDTVDPERLLPSALIHWRVKARTVVRYGLLIVMFSMAAGLAYQFQVVDPVSPYVDDTLRRLPYILAVLTAGVLADRRNLHALLVSGAGLLALSFLLIGWAGLPGLAYVSIALQGSAFGLLEAAPWLLLAGLSTPTTAGRWFGWGLNMNMIPILLGGLVALPFAGMSPERFGLLAATFTLLGLLVLLGVSDPLVLLHQWRPAAAKEPQVEPEESLQSTQASLSVPDLLAERYGELLSNRELEVAGLAVLGVSTRDIAHQLSVSENTVKTHLKNIYRKTESANRNDLYRRLVENTSASTSASAD
ncbi:MAG: LuxR C-terminal-related transcriptional regulator [Bacillota bacterium]